MLTTSVVKGRVCSNTYWPRICPLQQLMDLGDGTYLKLTIAEYYTPSGRSINGAGVEPDVEVENVYSEEGAEVDNQLEKALEVVSQ